MAVAGIIYTFIAAGEYKIHFCNERENFFAEVQFWTEATKDFGGDVFVVDSSEILVGEQVLEKIGAVPEKETLNSLSYFQAWNAVFNVKEIQLETTENPKTQKIEKIVLNLLEKY